MELVRETAEHCSRDHLENHLDALCLLYCILCSVEQEEEKERILSVALVTFGAG